MQLSKNNLKKIIPQAGIVIPDITVLSLPEKVLQFGTGVLLRGLPDYFIDKANRKGLFNGRIVIVKSTSQGDIEVFDKQDGLFTHCIKGIENGQNVEETIINSSVSRVLSANEDWETILECAADPAIQIIISNTTEVGITLVADDIYSTPPVSFPGKLLAFLYKRFKTFNGSEKSGMIIIPTELIMNNGNKLQYIVLELAKNNKLEEAFINWLNAANHFCNSLVDRIVPGKLPDNDKSEMKKKLGYTDELMIMSECFRLWAIESNSERVKQLLSFSQADDGIIIAPSIEKFRELKLRLLNGTHTFSCGVAYLSGFSTVKKAMADATFASFINHLAINEIATAITDENIKYEEACSFGAIVIDRFRNPFLDHQWLSISLQFSSKMKMRNVPILLNHFAKTNQLPEAMVLGFSCFLLFMNTKKIHENSYEGYANGKSYFVQDDNVAYFSEHWKTKNTDVMVDTILADKNFWGADLSALPGFTEAVKMNLKLLVDNGVAKTLSNNLVKLGQ
ncbi:MAG: tagaturonate reductase [Chitinophagaceae bacterium]